MGPSGGSNSTGSSPTPSPTPTPVSTPIPTLEPTASSTVASSTSTTTPSSCPREEQMMACVSQGGVFQCEHCADGAGNDPCCSCHEGEPISATTATTTATTATLESGSCKVLVCRKHKAVVKEVQVACMRRL